MDVASSSRVTDFKFILMLIFVITIGINILMYQSSIYNYKEVKYNKEVNYCPEIKLNYVLYFFTFMTIIFNIFCILYLFFADESEEARIIQNLLKNRLKSKYINKYYIDW